jgi:flagellar biosynthesis/type III secretory pathway M-ring protein FliF/YscJ
MSLAALFARWNALPRAARIVAGMLTSVVAAAAVAATLAAHPSRTALFPMPLHPEQLAEIQEQLAAWNVPFTPAAENVVVDSGRRNDLLLRLALAGVPHPHLSSTGEALSTIGVLTPEAVVEAQTRAGLSGDIEAGLRGLDGVDDARVIVAPAKPAQFADGAANDATASVRLRLRAGARLSHGAIAGIKAFVAASVPELASARVTILDDRGVALGDQPGAPDDASDLQRSLQTALDAAFGDGSAIVRVRAEYESSHSARREVRHTPFGARESFEQFPPGALRRLSAAVFVDRNRALDLVKVRQLASATLGYDVSRGDMLTVEDVDFRREQMPRRDAWWLLYAAVMPLAPALIVAIGLVACARIALPHAAGVVHTMVERAALDRASRAAAGFPPARVRTMLEEEPPHAAAAIISALPAATATAVLELYPPHEREAIVRRMQRRHSTLVPDAQELLRRHA